MDLDRVWSWQKKKLSFQENGNPAGDSLREMFAELAGEWSWSANGVVFSVQRLAVLTEMQRHESAKSIMQSSPLLLLLPLFPLFLCILIFSSRLLVSSDSSLFWQYNSDSSLCQV
jgi:hypothetical protein